MGRPEAGDCRPRIGQVSVIAPSAIRALEELI
jgi:hypothetical protein